MSHPLIEHHTKYEEIHGVDETVWMERSEHAKLHIRLRQTGKCNISPEKLQEISKKAYKRTDKCKKIDSKTGRKYRQTKQYKNRRKQRENEVIERIRINNTIAPNILLIEEIVHNKNTKHIFVLSRFVGNHGMKLITKEI